MKVRLRWIAGYRGFYKATSKGTIRSVERWIEVTIPGVRTYNKRVAERELLPNVVDDYEYVILCKPPRKKRACVHILICETFHGPKPTDKHEVNHKNGNKRDNRPENLEWVTRSRNCQHAWDAGLQPRKRPSVWKSKKCIYCGRKGTPGSRKQFYSSTICGACERRLRKYGECAVCRTPLISNIKGKWRIPTCKKCLRGYSPPV